MCVCVFHEIYPNLTKLTTRQSLLNELRKYTFTTKLQRMQTSQAVEVAEWSANIRPEDVCLSIIKDFIWK